MLILLMATALVPIAKKAFDVIGSHFDSKPAVTILHADPVHDEIFSIKLQVRDDEQAGRKVLGSSYLYAGQAFERWNSVSGRHIRGFIPRRIPFFIPQPRAGLEGTFKELADKGFEDIDLYIFPFTSDADLYKTAKKCGLGRSGRDSIVQWSTWREGDEKVQVTKCRPGGLCILLSRGCDDDAFSSDNRHSRQ